ncbi:hypothetical protein [Streptomyces sp. NPDC005336]|uniref:hypothetical protein n=1 Tax=Streptomyces sp. NPDC005336 TaxID=3157035 RepID=UPI0033A6D96F
MPVEDIQYCSITGLVSSSTPPLNPVSCSSFTMRLIADAYCTASIRRLTVPSGWIKLHHSQGEILRQLGIRGRVQARRPRSAVREGALHPQRIQLNSRHHEPSPSSSSSNSAAASAVAAPLCRPASR